MTRIAILILFAFSGLFGLEMDLDEARTILSKMPKENLLTAGHNSVLVQEEINYRIMFGGADKYFYELLIKPETEPRTKAFLLTCYSETGSLRVQLYALKELNRNVIPRKAIYWHLSSNPIPFQPLLLQPYIKMAYNDMNQGDAVLSTAASDLIHRYESNALHPGYWLSYIEAFIFGNINGSDYIQLIYRRDYHKSYHAIYRKPSPTGLTSVAYWLNISSEIEGLLSRP
jgi:hypothetical protein